MVIGATVGSVAAAATDEDFRSVTQILAEMSTEELRALATAVVHECAKLGIDYTTAVERLASNLILSLLESVLRSLGYAVTQ